MPRYQVMIDDNFHRYDESERTKHGVYDTAEEALATCRRIVDQSVEGAYLPGMTAEDLYQRYTFFGDDPFILVFDGADERAKFSAWDYAKERCRTLCAERTAGK
jgi:hypothetical protein